MHLFAGMYLPFNPEVLPTAGVDIYPGLSGPLNITAAQWNTHNLLIPDNATLTYIYNQGGRDAATWAEQNGFANYSRLQAALQQTAAVDVLPGGNALQQPSNVGK